MNLNHISLLFLLATIGSVGHFLIILSLKLGEASKLAPLGYFEIINKYICRFSFFGYLPDIYIYSGLFLIVSSGIYIFIREQKNIKKLITFSSSFNHKYNTDNNKIRPPIIVLWWYFLNNKPNPCGT